MKASGGSRIAWDVVPAAVRDAVGTALGSPVAEARNQDGGFSPGLAARARLADGRRVFVKAVSPDQNVAACRIHRRETEIAAALATVPLGRTRVPRLLHAHDDGHWVVSVFAHVDGTQPDEPWRADQLATALDGFAALHRDLTPAGGPDPGDSPSLGGGPGPGDVAGLGDVPAFAARHRPVFGGLARLAGGDGDPIGFDPDFVARLERFAAWEQGWEAASVGTTLVHADLRADNVLFDRDGTMWVVDWPWACVGAAWTDLVLFLPSVGLGGGPDPTTVADRHRLFADVDDDALRSLVAAVTGFFARACLDPAPPGLPRLRAFQRAQADVAIRWLLDLDRAGPVSH